MYNRLKIVVPIALLILFTFVQSTSWLQSIDNLIHDNVMVSGRSTSDSIIIVGMDERSLLEIGSWPWPRYFVAEAITAVAEMGAAAIGVNVMYDTHGPVPEYDQILIDAAKNTDRLVLGATGTLSSFQEDGGLLEIDYLAVPFGELRRATTVGFLNAIPDESDGVMRRMVTAFRFGDITVYSFPFELYLTYRRSMGQTPVALADIPLDEHGQFPIRYVGGPGSFTQVSLWGVINGFYSAEMFRDRIVLIGPYAPGIGEMNFTTPLERSIATHGVELYANVVQNFLEGVFVADASLWVNILILALSALIIALLYLRLKPLTTLILTVVMIGALLLGARLTYDNFHIIISVGGTIIFLTLCYLSNLSFSILAAQSDKQQIRSLFGRFVAPEVVEKIISGGVDIQLGGVVKEITALFVDVRGFTAFSEANPPQKVVGIINRYLNLTSRSIQRNNGTIDKFMGDATMALFNAPNDVPNHPLCAVKAAWAMKKGAVPLQDKIMREHGIDLQFGIGINTGDAVVGNMGSDFRMDYTAIGDAINTAARLESNARKGQIIISDATYQYVKDHVEVEELGIFNLKNKSVGVLVYSVINVRE